jgi:hypothetical protein
MGTLREQPNLQILLTEQYWGLYSICLHQENPLEKFGNHTKQINETWF